MLSKRRCKDCYFCDECGTKHVCGGFSPLSDPGITDGFVSHVIRIGEKWFYEEFWATMEEEDRMQDYWG